MSRSLIAAMGGMAVAAVLVAAPAQAEPLTCQGLAVTVAGNTGTPGNDVMVIDHRMPGRESLTVPAVLSADVVGTSGDDEITVRASTVKLRGRAGDDRLVVGVSGKSAKSVVRGGSGADEIIGSPGTDRLLGDRGTDRLWGLRGADKLVGGRGPDKLWGGPALDSAFGGKGFDTCPAERRRGCVRP